MDVRDYCGAMSTELTAWKAKMYDTVRKLDKLGTAEREKVLPNIESRSAQQRVPFRMEPTEAGDRQCPYRHAGKV
jgi:hypothetical protein